ncbi:hypothetical protein G7085_00510 [Tessaracoccus sp. HDW20]|nr:hypothetical protein [Tessaracoccus coleopterorum]
MADWLTRTSWHDCVRFRRMPSRPFIAARIEDRLNSVANRILFRRGWQESIIAFTGYGTPEQLRILARVVLKPSEDLGSCRRRRP